MKGIEEGRKIGLIDLEEIRRNFRQIAEEINPSSPSMREARDLREQADRRLAASGIIVIL